MKLEDYINALELPQEQRTETLSSIEGHFKAGHFTPKDVLDFYIKRDSPKHHALTLLYAQGKLFKAQMQSYESWAAGDYAGQDKNTVEDYLSLEDAAGRKRDTEGICPKIRLFIFTRIYGKRPSSSDTPEQAQKTKENWMAQNKANQWYWNT